MIESLHLKNFQAHTDLCIDFDPRVTTLTSPNDRGKTGILRALQWIFFNRPSGSKFVRHGTAFAKAVLKVDDRTVERFKGKGKNFYRLDGKRFNALGSAVPEPVVDLLNVGLSNIQQQHSLPFWFSETPGAVGKALNRIVNLELIDACLTRSAQLIRQAKVQADVGRERLTEAKAELEELAYVPAMQESFAQLEELEGRLGRVRERKESLSNLLGDLGRRWEELHGSAQVVRDGKELLVKAEELEEVHRRRDRLRTIIKGVEDARSEASGFKAQAAELQRKLTQVMGDRCPACGREFKEK